MTTSTTYEVTSDKSVYVFPASFAQEGLWFLNQLEPESATYNVPLAIRLRELPDVEVLQRSLNVIVQRHEVLRTTFTMIDGQLMQVVTPSLTVSLPVVDLRSLPETEREAEARRLATEEAQRPFDLTQGPLVRATFVHVGAKENLLLLTIHHIVSDGWSLGVLFHELATLYEAFSTGQPSPLPELPIQYADFVVWQREALQGDLLAKHLAYWKQRLAGMPERLDLPVDRPRLPVPTLRGATYCATLPRVLTEALKELSSQQGVTLYMTLVAAFQILLYRYTGLDDVVIGTIGAGRTQAETESLIGPVANTLLVRTDLSSNPTFRELLGRVREVFLEDQAHQDLPFETLVKELKPERQLGQNPLFQVLLEFDPPLPPPPSGWFFSHMEAETGTAKFDLTLYLDDHPEGLIGRFEYSTDLFDAETIVRMAGHWQTLLEGIVADPTRRLSELPLLTEKERHQLLVEWNATQAVYPKDQCVHQLFEAQVERTPEAVALVFEDEQLSYRELNARANQLAHHLQHLGVEPDVLVGICVERSLDMVVGLLGILKAGGVYVPLDANYPVERLAFMLEDTQAPVLLTQAHLQERLPQHAAQVVYLDADLEAIERHPVTVPGSAVHPNNLAYVLYTSGSTGKPKGVAIEHRSSVTFLDWATKSFSPQQLAGVLASTSINFDLSVYELFAPLCCGGSVILCENLLHLSSLPAARQVTLINTVPSILIELLKEHALPASVRVVNLAGEPLSRALAQRTYQQNTVQQVFNLYGPTEDTTYSTWTVVQKDASDAPAIGRPLPGTQVYILDRHLQPVPIGVAGELYLGGDKLARCYLNRPELTAERFLPNPFSEVPGARIYKTGDLARYRADGTIEHLGRLDYQVKIRGFRIELGEIEAVLSKHPAVQQVVVVAREDTPGNKRLVAYVVLQQAQIATVNALREHVTKALPAYMVPSAFVLLEVLPLTPNGKVDRRALPAPDANQLKLEENFVPPRTTIEKVLADIWAQVLQLDRVGVHNNFFELGGDSILSIQMIARANQAGLTLTPKHLFQNPTIAQLAAVITPAHPIEAQKAPVSGTVPLTPIQHWFFAQPFRIPHHWNQAWLLEVNQVLDGVLLEQAIQYVVAQHDALRLRFKPEGRGWLQWHEEPRKAEEVLRQVDLSGLPVEEQQVALEAIAAEAQASLNFETGPIVQIVYFQMGSNQPARLLIVIHHLVVDGVSWRILLEDLTTAYEHLRQGKVPHLPAKTTSFQQWAQQLTEYARLATLRRELPYWLNRARIHASPLPADYNDDLETNTMASARTVDVTLSAEETEALLHLVPKAYHTQINDVLLTALVQAFAQWTGERTLLVDLEGHGREPLSEEINLARTVGWFTTIFPVCLVLKDASPGEALKAVKEQLRHIPNHGIGYGVLRYLGEQEDSERLKALPKAQVSFNYLGQFDQMVSKTGLFNLARESAGPTCDQKETRPYLLEIEGLIVGGQLKVSWLYNERMHQRDTIERLAEYYLEALGALIAHCQSPEAGGHTPSDFEQLANALQEQGEVDRRSPVMAIQSGGSRRPFFFLHGQWKEGNAFFCYTIARDLGADQPFYVLEPYNFDGLRVPPTIEEIATAHLKSMRAVQPEGPYLLGGWCNGALLAYEMARQLHAAGQVVDLLALMDADDLVYPARLRRLRNVIHHVGGLVRLGPDKQLDWFLRLRHVNKYLRYADYRSSMDAEYSASVAPGEWGRRRNKVKVALSRLATLFPPGKFLREYIFIYNWIAIAYAPRSVYPGKIVFFWNRDEPDARASWHNVLEAAEVEEHFIPGTHTTLLSEHLDQLSEHLKECLSKAQATALSEGV